LSYIPVTNRKVGETIVSYKWSRHMFAGSYQARVLSDMLQTRAESKSLSLKSESLRNPYGVKDFPCDVLICWLLPLVCH
jgi:hypothetical protein